MLSKIAYRSALLPAAVVVALGLVVALTYLQPIVERNRLMLTWLGLVSLSEEPHRFYQTPLTDATKYRFSTLAGRLEALCRAAPGGAVAVCWRAEMARLVAADAQPYQPVQVDRVGVDATRQMMLAHVAGDVAYAEGRSDAAVAVWSQSLPPEMLIYKAEIVLEQGDGETAARLLERVERRRFAQPAGGRLARVLVELGNVGLDDGNFIDAEPYWRWALIQSPQRDTYYVGLGRALAGQQRWEEAAVVYRDAVQLAPDKVQHYLRLARVLVQMGEADQAISVLEHAAELEPGHAAVQRLLDWLGEEQP